jgi:hypothetical protein
MRKKLSKLTKKILPLAFSIIASTAYGNDKGLDSFVEENPYHFELSEKKNEGDYIFGDIPVFYYFSGPTGSYHFERDADPKPIEENFFHGWGVRWNNPPKIFGKQILGRYTDLFIMGVTNSEGYYSRAIGFNATITCTDTPINVCGRWGWGIVDGYPQNDFKWAPAVPLPSVSIEYKNIGVDIYVSSVVVMGTFKLKF